MATLLRACACPCPTRYPRPARRDGAHALRVPAGRLLHYSAALSGSTLCSVQRSCALRGANRKAGYFYSIITLNHLLLTCSFVPWYPERQSDNSLSVIKIRTSSTQAFRLLLRVQGAGGALGGPTCRGKGRGLSCPAPSAPSAGSPAPEALCGRRAEKGRWKGWFPVAGPPAWPFPGWYCDSVCSLWGGVHMLLWAVGASTLCNSGGQGERHLRTFIDDGTLRRSKALEDKTSKPATNTKTGRQKYNYAFGFTGLGSAFYVE